MNESMEDISIEIQDHTKNQIGVIKQPYASITNSSFSSQGFAQKRYKSQKKEKSSQYIPDLPVKIEENRNFRSPQVKKNENLKDLEMKSSTVLTKQQVMKDKQYQNEHINFLPLQMQPKEMMINENYFMKSGSQGVQQTTDSSSSSAINESTQVKQIMDIIDQLERFLGNSSSQSPNKKYKMPTNKNDPSELNRLRLIKKKATLFSKIKENLIELSKHMQGLNTKEHEIAKQERAMQKKLYQLLRKEQKLQTAEGKEFLSSDPLHQLFNRLERSKEIFNENLRKFNKDVQKLQKKEKQLLDLQKQIKDKKNDQQQCTQCLCHLDCHQLQHNADLINQQNINQNTVNQFQSNDLKELDQLLDQSSFISNAPAYEFCQESSEFKQNNAQISLKLLSTPQIQDKPTQQSQDFYELDETKQELLQQLHAIELKEQQISKQKEVLLQLQNQKKTKNLNLPRQQVVRKEIQKQEIQKQIKKPQSIKRQLYLQEDQADLMDQDLQPTEQLRDQNENAKTERHVRILFSPLTTKSSQSQAQIDSIDLMSPQHINKKRFQFLQKKNKTDQIQDFQKSKEKFINDKQNKLKKAKANLENAYAKLRTRSHSFERLKETIKSKMLQSPRKLMQTSVQESFKKKLSASANKLYDFDEDDIVEMKSIRIPNKKPISQKQNIQISIQERNLNQVKMAKAFVKQVINKSKQKNFINFIFIQIANQIENGNKLIDNKMIDLQQKLQKVNQQIKSLQLKESIENTNTVYNYKKYAFEKLKIYKFKRDQEIKLQQTEKKMFQLSKSPQAKRSQSQTRFQNVTRSQEINKNCIGMQQDNKVRLTLYLQSSLINNEGNNGKLQSQNINQEEKLELYESVCQSQQISLEQTLKLYERKLNKLQSQLSSREINLELRKKELQNQTIQNKQGIQQQTNFLAAQKESFILQQSEIENLHEVLEKSGKQMKEQRNTQEAKDLHLKEKELAIQTREQQLQKQSQDLQSEIDKYQQINQENNLKKQKMQIQEDIVQKQIQDLVGKSQNLDYEIIQLEKKKQQLQSQQSQVEQQITQQSKLSTQEEKKLEEFEQQLIQQEKELNKRFIQLSNLEQAVQQKDGLFKQQFAAIEKKKTELLHQETICEQKAKALALKERKLNKQMSISMSRDFSSKPLNQEVTNSTQAFNIKQ